MAMNPKRRNLWGKGVILVVLTGVNTWAHWMTPDPSVALFIHRNSGDSTSMDKLVALPAPGCPVRALYGSCNMLRMELSPALPTYSGR